MLKGCFVAQCFGNCGGQCFLRGVLLALCCFCLLLAAYLLTAWPCCCLALPLPLAAASLSCRLSVHLFCTSSAPSAPSHSRSLPLAGHPAGLLACWICSAAAQTSITLASLRRSLSPSRCLPSLLPLYAGRGRACCAGCVVALRPCRFLASTALHDHVISIIPKSNPKNHTNNPPLPTGPKLVP